MSWTVSVTGTPDEIAKGFDAVREQASGLMIEAEQRDIDEARDFAVQVASTHGRVAVSASGHWNTYTDDDPLGRKNHFGRVSITVVRAVD